MTMIVLRCILLCLLAANIAQAAAPVPTIPWTPPTHVLSPEELAPLLQEWDEAIAGDKFRDKDDVLGKVKGRIPKGMHYAGRYFLYYSNPEIRDRVIALYLKEGAREEAGQPISADANEVFRHPESEGGAEYLIFLSTLAESTFDPRIYEAVLLGLGLTGDFRELYLATVNAERTLDLLSEAKPGPEGRILRGKNTGKEGHPEYFYHNEFDIMLTVVGAYDILSLMVAQSPEALRAKRSQVLSFIANTVKHFAKPHKLSYEPKPVYFRWYDYDVRSAALDIVGFLGTVTEMRLVEEIIRDAPKVDFENRMKIMDKGQIREKGLRIIAQIQGRSPSGR
jgi:hypothetical protein